VGLFRLEDLKAGQGSPDWLRLLRLMSAEFALAEGCIEPADLGSRYARVTEIIELDKKLNATNTLENLTQAVRYTEYVQDPQTATKYWLIKYDKTTSMVSVEPQISALSGAKSYDQAEYVDTKGNINTVLVEADKIETLKYAYPNYFGDVQLFRERLRYITKGDGAKQCILKPQEIIPPRPKVWPDLSWFKRRKRWK
jgi:hypothetical protein